MAISELITFDGGLSTKTSSHLISRNEGLVCQNVNLEKGTLYPISRLEYLTTITGRHLHRFNDRLVWNNSLEDNRFYDSYSGRLYWTDCDHNSGLRKYKYHNPDDYTAWNVATAYTTGDIVKYTINTIDYAFYAMQASTGQTPVLTNTTYWALADNVGVTAQAPAAMSDAQLAAISMAVDTVADGRLTYLAEYTYAFTIVDSEGIESAPRIKVSAVTLNNKNNLAIMMSISKTDWTNLFSNIIGINIYRTGGDNPTFNLIGEHLIASSFGIIDGDTDPDYTAGYYYFVDTIADINVSRIELTTFENTPPPDDLDMLIELKGTFWGAWDNKIYFSQSGTPEFWGSLDYVTLDKECTGLGKIGDSIVAFTLTSAYLINGFTRDNISVQRLPFNQGCVNKHSVANIDAYLIWASMNGICIYDGAQIQVVTKKTLAWDEFKRLGNKKYDDFYEEITSFTATASQTTFAVNFLVGMDIDVLYLGDEAETRLVLNTDYTVSGTDIVLTNPCTAGDIVYAKSPSTDKWDGGSGFNMLYGVGYQDRYYGVFNNGVMVLDLANGIKVSTIDAENVASVSYNYEDNFLYVIVENFVDLDADGIPDEPDGTFDVYTLTTDGYPAIATWKTGDITDGTVNVRKHYRSVEVDGEPLSITVYIDGVEKYTVANKSKFMLPSNLIGRNIQFEITTENIIRGIKYEYTQLKA